MSGNVHIDQLDWDQETGSARAEFRLDTDILFDLDFRFSLSTRDGSTQFARHIRQDAWDVKWLPRGAYAVAVRPDPGALRAGPGRLEFTLYCDVNETARQLATASTEVEPSAGETAGIATDQWRMESSNGTDLARLSWKKGHLDWFFLHFDHAAAVIIELMLKRSPKLKGRILDVGCGDGVTDLGVFLRCRPELLIGVDPFEGYRRLPAIMRENQLPVALLDDPRLRFEAHSGNALPYPDDHFDVVLSWGSLEHIAGGYGQALEEIRRVLKPGGLFFVHPGLYYSTLGNHLGEFFDDPFIHLKIPAGELREKVLSTEPDYIDRAGEFSSPEDYWRWYTELNPITVPQIEKELRALGFEPWRVALRTADVIEYTPEMQAYGMDQLATAEMYASFVLKA